MLAECLWSVRHWARPWGYFRKQKGSLPARCLHSVGELANTRQARNPREYFCCSDAERAQGTGGMKLGGSDQKLPESVPCATCHHWAVQGERPLSFLSRDQTWSGGGPRAAGVQRNPLGSGEPCSKSDHWRQMFGSLAEPRAWRKTRGQPSERNKLLHLLFKITLKR